jgi:drug/metabolite transporter (DMT)-like permease
MTIRRRLSRGIVWGAIMSVASIAAIVTFVPILNDVVITAMALAVLASMVIGIGLNLRARTVRCPLGHEFMATSGGSRCPDCGQKGSTTNDATIRGNT